MKSTTILHCKVISSLHSEDAVLVTFLQFDLCWPQLTFDFHQKNTKDCCLIRGWLAHGVWYHSMLVFMWYYVYKVFTVWPLLTSNDCQCKPRQQSCTWNDWYTYQVWSHSNLFLWDSVFTRISHFDLCSTHLTIIDLHQKIIGFCTQYDECTVVF